MKPYQSTITTREYKLVTLRECLAPGQMAMADTAELAAGYIRQHIHTAPTFNPDLECMATLILNTRRRVIGHILNATGTGDTILVSPREIFRGAIVAGAGAIIITHNHPSGDPTPSEADIRVTRDLIKAGMLLKIEVLDHLIMGHPAEGKGFTSLRELGYFYS